MAGRFMNVMSVCQKSVRSLPLSMEWISLRSTTCGSTGWLSVSSPKRLAKAIWRVVVEPLVGEEHHEPLEPDPTDGVDDVVVEVGRAIDAVDLGADGGAQGADVEVDLAQGHASMVAPGRAGGTAPTAGLPRGRGAPSSRGSAMFSAMRGRLLLGRLLGAQQERGQDEAEEHGARRR